MRHWAVSHRSGSSAVTTAASLAPCPLPHGIRKSLVCISIKNALRDGYTIISKDSDFHQMSLVRGFPPKVIFLKVGSCSTEVIISLFEGGR